MSWAAKFNLTKLDGVNGFSVSTVDGVNQIFCTYNIRSLQLFIKQVFIHVSVQGTYISNVIVRTTSVQLKALINQGFFWISTMVQWCAGNLV